MKKTIDRNYQNNTTVEISEDKSRADIEVEGMNGLLQLDEDDTVCVMTPTMYMAQKEHKLHQEQFKKVFDELNERRYVAPTKDDVVACGHERDDDYITEKKVVNYCTQPEKAMMKNESVIRRMFEAKAEELSDKDDLEQHGIFAKQFDATERDMDKNEFSNMTVAEMLLNRLVFDHQYQYRSSFPNFANEPTVYKSAVGDDGRLHPAEGTKNKNNRFSPNQAVGEVLTDSMIHYGMVDESDFDLVKFVADRFHLDRSFKKTLRYDKVPFAFTIKIPFELQEVPASVLLKVEKLSNGFKDGFELTFSKEQTAEYDYLDYRNVCEYYFNNVDVTFEKKIRKGQKFEVATLTVSGPKF